MLGAGINKADISGIKWQVSHDSIEDIGEGLGVAPGLLEEGQDFIEALQFTQTKPKKSKTRPSDEKENQPKQINFEDTMRSQGIKNIGQPHKQKLHKRVSPKINKLYNVFEQDIRAIVSWDREE